MEKKHNIILTKTFEFACNILDLNEKLVELKQYQVANQIVRSGTSIGANVTEAQRAVSKADFINSLNEQIENLSQSYSTTPSNIELKEFYDTIISSVNSL